MYLLHMQGIAVPVVNPGYGWRAKKAPEHSKPARSHFLFEPFLMPLNEPHRHSIGQILCIIAREPSLLLQASVF